MRDKRGRGKCALLLVGPIARALFRLMFRRVNGAEEKKVEGELLKEGFAE